MQSRKLSLIEVITGRLGMWLITSTFSLWWIPKEAPDILHALNVTWPYILIGIAWTYMVRRSFERLGPR